MTGFMDLSLTINMYANTKIGMYPVGIYLLKVINENSSTRCVKNDLIGLKTLRNIDVALVSLLILKRFHTFS